MSNRGIGVGHRKSAAPMIVAAVVIATAAVCGGWFWLRHQGRLEAETRAWTVAGPPCPQMTAAAFAAWQPTPHQVFEYNDVVYTRYGGHVSCANVAPGEADMQSVCQFSGPAVLKVALPTETVFFAPGAGQKATTSISRGEARCVLGARETF